MTRTLEKTEIIVDRSVITNPNDLIWPLTHKNMYGQYTIAEENPFAAKVKLFDIATDVTLISCVYKNHELISAEEKIARLAQLGYVPLDIYCLRTILAQPDFQKYIEYLQEKFWGGGIGGPVASAFDVPGTILLDGCTEPRRHIYHIDFKYDGTAVRGLKEICPIETHDQGWGLEDPSIVFSAEFSKKLMAA